MHGTRVTFECDKEEIFGQTSQITCKATFDDSEDYDALETRI